MSIKRSSAFRADGQSAVSKAAMNTFLKTALVFILACGVVLSCLLGNSLKAFATPSGTINAPLFEPQFSMTFDETSTSADSDSSTAEANLIFYDCPACTVSNYPEYEFGCGGSHYKSVESVSYHIPSGALDGYDAYCISGNYIDESVSIYVSSQDTLATVLEGTINFQVYIIDESSISQQIEFYLELYGKQGLSPTPLSYAKVTLSRMIDQNDSACDNAAYNEFTASLEKGKKLVFCEEGNEFQPYRCQGSPNFDLERLLKTGCAGEHFGIADISIDSDSDLDALILVKPGDNEITFNYSTQQWEEVAGTTAQNYYIAGKKAGTVWLNIHNLNGWTSTYAVYVSDPGIIINPLDNPTSAEIDLTELNLEVYYCEHCGTYHSYSGDFEQCNLTIQMSADTPVTDYILHASYSTDEITSQFKLRSNGGGTSKNSTSAITTSNVKIIEVLNIEFLGGSPNIGTQYSGTLHLDYINYVASPDFGTTQYNRVVPMSQDIALNITIVDAPNNPGYVENTEDTAYVIHLGDKFQFGRYTNGEWFVPNKDLKMLAQASCLYSQSLGFTSKEIDYSAFVDDDINSLSYGDSSVLNVVWDQGYKLTPYKIGLTTVTFKDRLGNSYTLYFKVEPPIFQVEYPEEGICSYVFRCDGEGGCDSYHVITSTAVYNKVTASSEFDPSELEAGYKWITVRTETCTSVPGVSSSVSGQIIYDETTGELTAVLYGSCYIFDATALKQAFSTTDSITLESQVVYTLYSDPSGCGAIYGPGKRLGGNTVKQTIKLVDEPDEKIGLQQKEQKRVMAVGSVCDLFYLVSENNAWHIHSCKTTTEAINYDGMYIDEEDSDIAEIKDGYLYYFPDTPEGNAAAQTVKGVTFECHWGWARGEVYVSEENEDLSEYLVNTVPILVAKKAGTFRLHVDDRYGQQYVFTYEVSGTPEIKWRTSAQGDGWYIENGNLYVEAGTWFSRDDFYQLVEGGDYTGYQYLDFESTKESIFSVKEINQPQRTGVSAEKEIQMARAKKVGMAYLVLSISSEGMHAGYTAPTKDLPVYVVSGEISKSGGDSEVIIDDSDVLDEIDWIFDRYTGDYRGHGNGKLSDDEAELSGVAQQTITELKGSQGTKVFTTVNFHFVNSATGEEIPLTEIVNGNMKVRYKITKEMNQFKHSSLKVSFLDENGVLYEYPCTIVDGYIEFETNHFSNYVFYSVDGELIDINSASVGSISDQTYTGAEITPKPVVTYGGKTLTENVDYTLSYSNNIQVGTATVTVTGMSDYTGTLNKTFTIKSNEPPQAAGITFDLTGISLSSGATKIYLDGVAYDMSVSGNTGTVLLSSISGTPRVATLYTYNKTAGDTHEIYPTNMYVWLLTKQGNTYSSARVSGLDNLLQYAGSSIRITGKKGIRMITSIPTEVKNALTSASGYEGWQLEEYGTVLEFDEVLAGKDVLLSNTTHHNYAYKRGVTDPIYKQGNGLVKYTNVLVGFNDAQCAKDLSMRPYIILKNKATGETITIYGGAVHRSIGYIAYQNRTAFEKTSDAGLFIWGIIRSVYGNIYG